MVGPQGRRGRRGLFLGRRLDSAERVDTAISLDPSLAERIRSRARRRLISLRLPVWQIETAKRLAKHLDRPYQRLIQAWIARGLHEEMRERAGQHA